MKICVRDYYVDTLKLLLSNNSYHVYLQFSWKITTAPAYYGISCAKHKRPARVYQYTFSSRPVEL